jgi:parvulin-like peptidyl-prolyl isomerase
MQTVVQQLQNGATFDALAAQFSEDERTKLRGGDLGWFATARMPEDFMAAVAKLKPGTMSGIVRTKLGWHVIKLIEIRPAAPVEFDDVKAEIVAMLANQERAQAVSAVLSK